MAVFCASVPIGRPIPGIALQKAPGGWPERVRHSRQGTVIEAGSFGWVPSGASLRGSLARPQLQFPSARKWLELRAWTEDLGVEVSAVGYQQVRARALFTSTMELAEGLHENRRLFECFGSTGKTEQAFSDGGGVVLSGRAALLSIEGLKREVGWNDEQTREIVDDLLERGVLRRGLIFRCPNCATVDWFPVGVVSPNYRLSSLCRRL